MSREHPYFSVIMTFYNSVAFIEDAVKSIIFQNFQDFEIIIVDNGSKDASREIVQGIVDSHSERNITIVDIKDNQGIAGGRNAGITKARGKYVCFIDSDDIWYPNKLAVVYRALKNDNTYDVIYHWMDIGNEKQKQLSRRRAINNKNAVKDLLFNGDPIPMSSAVVSADMLHQVNGFDANCHYAEDFDCWIRLAKKGAKFKLVTKPLGLYRIHGESTSQKQKEFTEKTAEMLHKHVDESNSAAASDRYHKLIECHRYYLLFNSEKDFDLAMMHFKRIIKIRPFWIKAYVRFLQRFMRSFVMN